MLGFRIVTQHSPLKDANVLTTDCDSRINQAANKAICISPLSRVPNLGVSAA